MHERDHRLTPISQAASAKERPPLHTPTCHPIEVFDIRLIEESVPGVTVWIVAFRGSGRPGSHIRCRPVMAWLPNDVPAVDGLIS